MQIAEKSRNGKLRCRRNQKTKPAGTTRESKCFTFRTSTDREVDIVLETPNGEVVGIEVKSGAHVGSEAFKGLRALKEHSGKKFKRGIVIYTGNKAVAFDEDMYAVPVQQLWRSSSNV